MSEMSDVSLREPAHLAAQLTHLLPLNLTFKQAGGGCEEQGCKTVEDDLG